MWLNQNNYILSVALTNHQVNAAVGKKITFKKNQMKFFLNEVSVSNQELNAKPLICITSILVTALFWTYCHFRQCYKFQIGKLVSCFQIDRWRQVKLTDSKKFSNIHYKILKNSSC